MRSQQRLGFAQMPGDVVEICMGFVNPGLTPVEIATGFGPEQMPVGFVQHPRQLGIGIVGTRRRLRHHVKFPADVMHPNHGVALDPGTLPLMEIPAMMRVRVPGPTPYRDPAMRAEPVQIVADEDRPQVRMAGTNFLQRFMIEVGPEVGLRSDVAEPAAVIAVGGGGHQRRKVAPLGAFVQLVIEPAVIHAGQLGVGQFTVADDDDDLFAAVLGDVRPVAQFLPMHRIHRVHVLTVHQNVTITGLFQVRDQPHIEAHFRRPEPVELGAPEQMAGDRLPAGDVFIPVRFGNQRQHRVIVTGAENLENLLVL